MATMIEKTDDICKLIRKRVKEEGKIRLQKDKKDFRNHCLVIGGITLMNCLVLLILFW